MSKTLTTLILAIFTLPLCSYENSGLVNRPMPLLSSKTLDGKTIDENYYKGHVTVVSFMFIGCIPCMMEISTLNALTDEYSSNTQLQILCIARQMSDQMMQFNSTGKSPFSMVRKAYNIDPIKYPIQPACDVEKSKNEITEHDSVTEVYLKSECNTIEHTYGVNTMPVLFFVDKKGIIRKIEVGGPQTKNDAAFHNKLKKEIDLLLAE